MHRQPVPVPCRFSIQKYEESIGQQIYNFVRRSKFHTSPAIRKVNHIQFNDRAAMTYSFQPSLRSISLAGHLRPLGDTELERDWLRYDRNFRRHYMVFGEKPGSKLASAAELVSESDALKAEAEEKRPESLSAIDSRQSIEYRSILLNAGI
jgi:pyridoxine/pyridoxamine 5'-phosphate oxidase